MKCCGRRRSSTHEIAGGSAWKGACTTGGGGAADEADDDDDDEEADDDEDSVGICVASSRFSSHAKCSVTSSPPCARWNRDFGSASPSSTQQIDVFSAPMSITRPLETPAPKQLSTDSCARVRGGGVKEISRD